jgi:ABC-type transport system substrate-binding protein
MKNMKKISRLLALALCLALCLTLLAGCGGSSDDTASTATTSTSSAATAADPTAPDTYKVFTYGADANSTTFDPYADLQTKSGAALCNAVGETLWKLDSDGNVEYKLATDAQWTGDLELTISLQQGVVYSNGNPFTSADVLYTLEHMRDTDRTTSMVASVDFDNTYCPDDNTIVVEFTAYDAAFFSMLGACNSVILDKETCEADPAFSWFVGTGPYKLEKWEESVAYTLTRNDYYWGDLPYYDEIDIKFYSSESTLYSDFAAGNLDAIYVTESTYINNLASGAVSNAMLVQRAQSSVNGFTLAVNDSTKGTLSDINIRKAFAHALDIETIVNSIGEGIYLPADSILTESSWAYESQGVYEYDPELAAQYLAAAGYSKDNPLNLTLVAEATSFQSALAEAAQAYLAEIGINLDISGMGDFATILPMLISGDMDVSIGSPSSESSDDPAALLQQLGPDSDNDLLRIEIPEVSTLFTQAASSRDNAERAALYAEYQEAVHDQYLFIPMWIGTLNYGVLATHTSFQNALDANNTFNPCLLTD